jgi:hypothetical protein
MHPDWALTPHRAAVHLPTATAVVADLRDAVALEQLPAAERAAWRTFWTEVEAFRKRPGKHPPHVREPAEGSGIAM